MGGVDAVIVAAHNDGYHPMARLLCRETLGEARCDELLEGDPPLQVAGDTGTIASRGPTGDVTLSLEGQALSLGDLDAVDLLGALQVFVTAEADALAPSVREDLQWITEHAAAVRALDRVRLLLEDCLFEPRRRPVAAARLRSLAARERRDRRDVEGLFDR